MGSGGDGDGAPLFIGLQKGYGAAVDLVSGERQSLPLRLQLKQNQVQVWRITGD